MYRRIAIVLLIVLNALTPAFSNACAASCAIGFSVDLPATSDQGTDSADSQMPCRGGTQSPDQNGSGAGDAGSMAAMCAFAAGGVIASAPVIVSPVVPSDRIAFVEISQPSFLSLPADKPPRA